MSGKYPQSRGMPSLGVPESPPSLSEREARLLVLLAEGGTRHNIAGKLFISPASVGAAIHALCVRFHVGGSTALVAKAYGMGLLTTWPPTLNTSGSAPALSAPAERQK